MDCSPPGSSIYGIFQASVLEWGAIAFSGRREPPTPVFWPGEFHGQRTLAGYSPCGHKESDTTFTSTYATTCNVISISRLASSLCPKCWWSAEAVVDAVYTLGFCHRLLELHSRVDEEKFFNWKNKNPALPEVRKEGWEVMVGWWMVMAGWN